MKNQDWKGRKKEHEKGFMGFDKKTNIQYANCYLCDSMWADGKLMNKKQIDEYLKKPTSDFDW